MSKQFKSGTVIAAVLLAPGILFAATNSFTAAKVNVGTNNTIVVPLEVSNENGLMAIDIPLKFSEGVTLKEVTFEGTRTEYFDLKLSNINNDKRQVVIGLISQASATRKPELTAGNGAIANLVFEVTDPKATELKIETVKLENPHHSLSFIYRNGEGTNSTHTRVEPTFSTIALSLSGANGILPTEYSIEQNYPNPFNPKTNISFALPVSGNVSIAVYNVLGQEVKSLVDQPMEAGHHTITWDGTNNGGSQVSSGVYFYRITAGTFTESRKMMMLK